MIGGGPPRTESIKSHSCGLNPSAYATSSLVSFVAAEDLNWDLARCLDIETAPRQILQIGEADRVAKCLAVQNVHWKYRN